MPRAFLPSLSLSPNRTNLARLRPSGAALGLALSALSLLSAGCAPPGRTLLISSPEQSPPGVLVTGEGKASAPPDVARMTLHVEARAPGVEQASEEVTTKMQAVIATLKAAGIADRDLRTNQISIRRETPPPGYPMPYPTAYAAPMITSMAPPVATMRPPGLPRPQVAPMPSAVFTPPPDVFVVSNALEVCVRDLKRVGPILATATKTGINGLSGPVFTREDDVALERQAREKAVQNARTRAEQLARLAGVKLGPVVSISDVQGGGLESGYAAPMSAMSVPAGGMPVEPGEVQAVRHVQVRFSLVSND